MCVFSGIDGHQLLRTQELRITSFNLFLSIIRRQLANKLDNIMHILHKKSANILSEVYFILKSCLNFTLCRDVTLAVIKFEHLLPFFLFLFLTLELNQFLLSPFISLKHCRHNVYNHYFH